MKISLIGSGRVATHLALGLKQAGHTIVQVYSPHHAQRLATQVQADAIHNIEALNCEIDVLFIAVNDQAISAVIQALPSRFKDVCVIHTSGSTDLNVLTQHHAFSAVLYPLQTFSLEKEVNWTDIPLLIESNNQQAEQIVHTLAQSLSPKIFNYSSQQRLSLHLAAVFACNFSNYCYDMAHQITQQASIDFSLLHPLILETALKVTQFIPQNVQTGPAIREDQNILAMHQHLLSQMQVPHLKQMYEALSAGIQRKHL